MKSGIPKHIVLVLGIAGLLLQACGGGGGDGDGDSSPPPAATYTLSGVVRPASGAAIDSDVNDPNAPYQSNDTLATAQALPNPVTLGGHVNRPGRGPSGRSFDVGDVADFYRVSLLAGQQINLYIAGDGIENDLDLLLADFGGSLIDASIGLGRVKSLTVGADGDYLVVVAVDRGASNYVLTIGQTLAPTEAGLRLSDPFVSGEAVVLLEKKATARNGGLRVQAQSLGWLAGREEETEPRNMRFDLTELRRAGTYSTLSSVAASGFHEDLQIDDPELRDKLETLYQIKALNRDPDVKVASPNFIRRTLFVPNDPLYAFQWHYPQINLPQAWDLTAGSDTIVAVIDTGVVLSHPDLQGQLLPGYDFISSPANAGDGDGIDPDPTDPGDRANADGSSSFHGTHVIGTVAAATHNSVGVAGVAFGAKVMPLRALGRLGGTDYDIEQAVLFAAGLPNDSGTLPARRADVINLSIGGIGFSAASPAVYDQARAAGVVIVAAAGNQATDIPVYPAAFPGVIAVGAVDINKQRAPYSNFGPWIDVVAPGGDTARDVNGDGKPDGVLSTSASDGGGALVNDYSFLQGTSMAVPHVAGVVALMKSVAPDLTPREVTDLLVSGALTDDLDAPGKDENFGHGLINAYKAVIAAANRTGQPMDPAPVLAVDPAALNFGSILTSQNVAVLNGGAGSLTVNPPTEDSGGWLSVTPTQVDANSGLGVFTVAVRREGLADGTHSATVTFVSNAGTLQTPVIIQVATELSADAVGQQYVWLIDPATRNTVADVAAQPQADGSHAFSLSGIPAGTYQLFAGSDSNYDQFICDEGESCGAYLTLDRPISLEVDRDLSGLDFVSSFTVNLAASQRMGEDETERGLRRGSRKQIGVGR